MTHFSWTLPQICKTYKIHANTAYREIKRGKLVGHRIGGKFQFTDDQVEMWLQRRKT